MATIRLYKSGKTTWFDVPISLSRYTFATVARARTKTVEGEIVTDLQTIMSGGGVYLDGTSFLGTTGKSTVGSVQLFNMDSVIFHYGHYNAAANILTQAQEDGDTRGNFAIPSTRGVWGEIIQLPSDILLVGMNFFAFSFGLESSLVATEASTAYMATPGILTVALSNTDNDPNYDYIFTLSGPPDIIIAPEVWRSFRSLAQEGLIITLTIKHTPAAGVDREGDVVYCSAISNLHVFEQGAFLNNYNWDTWVKFQYDQTMGPYTFENLSNGQLTLSGIRFSRFFLQNKHGGFWDPDPDTSFSIKPAAWQYSLGDTTARDGEGLKITFRSVVTANFPSYTHTTYPVLDSYYAKITTVSWATQLIAYYSFHDGSLSNMANDKHDGQPIGVVSSADDRFLRKNYAYGFKPTGYINCGTESLNITDEMTVAIWAYFNENPVDPNEHHRIISKHGTTPETWGWTLMKTPGTELEWSIANKTPSEPEKPSEPEWIPHTTDKGTCPTGQWLHIVAMVERNTTTKLLEKKVYVDGQQAMMPVALPGGFSMFDSVSPLLIGADGYSSSEYDRYRRMDGRLDDIGIWNRALSESEIQALSNIRPSATETMSYGDPYITPVYGPKYKLPDRYGLYRYISSRAPYEERFTLDVDVLGLTKEQQHEGLQTLVTKYKDILAKYNKKVVLDGFFFRNYLLINKGEKLLVDTEANTINNCPVENFTTAEDSLFAVKVGGKQTVTMWHKKDDALYTVSIATHHETYGDIAIELYKFENPQWRNGIMMCTSKRITHKNSKGLILGFQHAKNFTIKKLGSKKDILDFDTKKISNVKEVVEEFSHIKAKGAEITTKKVINRFKQQR
jgi:hypothetical protein